MPVRSCFLATESFKRARERPRLAPGSIRVAKLLGLEASSTSLAVRRHHNHNRSIDVTWQYRKNQSLRYSVSLVPLLYINSDFDTSLVDYRHSLQATCCLRQTKPAVLAPLHRHSEDKYSEKSHRFWKSRHHIHRLLYSVL